MLWFEKLAAIAAIILSLEAFAWTTHKALVRGRGSVPRNNDPKRDQVARALR